MWHGWVSSSANEQPLQRAMDLVRGRSKAEGRLIIVRGEAGAGASAFASRLHRLLARDGVRSALVPRTAMNADFVFMTHLLRSLGLPIYSTDIHPPRRVSHPYIAALHLRQYQVIAFEDAHDFFSKHQQKQHLIYQVLSHLLKPPFGYDIVFCGVHDALTEVGLRARGMGIEVVFLDLNAMKCDDAYQKFVTDTLINLNVSKVLPCLVASTKPPNSPMAAHDLLQQKELDAESDLFTFLGGATFASHRCDFLTLHGIDLYDLHEQTKGLVGKTVTALESLRAQLLLGAATVVSGTGRSAFTSNRRIEMPQAATTCSLRLDTRFPSFSGIRRATSECAYRDVRPPRPTGFTQCDRADPVQVVDVELNVVGSRELPMSQGQADISEPQANNQSSLPPAAAVGATEPPYATPTFEGMPPAQCPLPVQALELVDAAFPRTLPCQGSAQKCQISQSSRSPARSPDHTPKTKSPSRPGFESFLKPVTDETLSSWLSRNACSRTIAVIHDDFLRWCTELVLGSEQSYVSYSQELLPRKRTGAKTLNDVRSAPGFDDTATSPRLIGVMTSEEPGENHADLMSWHPSVLLGSAGRVRPAAGGAWEHDTLYGSQAFLEAFPTGLHLRIPIQFALPNDATHPRENRKYCAQCIADDVAALRAPALRRAWRKRGAAVCTNHRHPVLLQSIDRGSLSDLTGSWLAYSQHAMRDVFDHGTGLVSRSAHGFQEVTEECRICRIVGRIQDWVESAPAHPTIATPSKYALYFLLGFFLYQGNLNSEGGVARWFFKLEKGSRLNCQQFEKPTVQQMVTNIETAAPKALAMAYLLIGCAFNLIRPAEYLFLKRALKFTDCIFPTDRHRIKTLAQCFSGYHSSAIWESAKNNLSAEDLIHVEWLLKE